MISPFVLDQEEKLPGSSDNRVNFELACSSHLIPEDAIFRHEKIGLEVSGTNFARIVINKENSVRVGDPCLIDSLANTVVSR